MTSHEPVMSAWKNRLTCSALCMKLPNDSETVVSYKARKQTLHSYFLKHPPFHAGEQRGDLNSHQMALLGIKTCQTKQSLSPVIAVPVPGNTVTVGDSFGGSSPSSSSSSGSGSTTRVGDTFGPSRFNFAANGDGDDDNDDDGSDSSNNSGTIQNGDTTNFDISNSSDVSGLFNVGSGSNFDFNNSSFKGNGKRQTFSGNDDGNSGDIFNGNNVSFGATNSSDVAGVFNAGIDNTAELSNSTSVIGNSERSE